MFSVESIESLALSSFIASMTFAVTGFIILFFILRFLDKICGFSFKEWINDEKTTDGAIAFYLGARIIAAAILLSGIISVPF